MEEKDIISAIRYNVLQGRRHKDDEGLDDEMTGKPGVCELVGLALDKKMPVSDILLYGITAGMKEVGRKYEAKEYFIPDMLAAAEAAGVAAEILEPYLAREGQPGRGKIILATVEKDQHDIGKNIVGVMLKGAGFQVIDLGINVPSVDIAAAVEREKPSFLGLSALLDTTMRYMQYTMDILQEKELRSSVKVIIGGAPTTPEFARKIGADAYCRDAFEAVSTLEKMSRENGGALY